MPWSRGAAGVVELPSGTLVRGRALRHDLGPADLTLLLLAPPFDRLRERGDRLRERRAGARTRVVAWPDFGVPSRRAVAAVALREAYARARAGDRVEVACRGGVGRTGTALAALAVLDGSSPADAVRWVRDRYHPRAVETPWQRRWLGRLAPS